MKPFFILKGEKSKIAKAYKFVDCKWFSKYIALKRMYYVTIKLNTIIQLNFYLLHQLEIQKARARWWKKPEQRAKEAKAQELNNLYRRARELKHKSWKAGHENSKWKSQRNLDKGSNLEIKAKEIKWSKQKSQEIGNKNRSERAKKV